MSSAWEKLSAIDCGGKIEKRGSLSYLSWAWAWGILLSHYPDSQHECLPDDRHEDGTVMVNCAVTVDGITRKMWLPVMDNRNNAITNPNARQISDARMRCLAKCIAMHGLGHYIYAGEDLPDAVAEAKITEEQSENLLQLMLQSDTDGEKFLQFFHIEKLGDMKATQYEKAHKMLVTKMEKRNVK